jgi:hypothetical protein
MYQLLTKLCSAKVVCTFPSFLHLCAIKPVSSQHLLSNFLANFHHHIRYTYLAAAPNHIMKSGFTTAVAAASLVSGAFAGVKKRQSGTLEPVRLINPMHGLHSN